MDAREVLDGTLEALFETSPESATAAGDHRFDDRLDDLTPAGVRHRVAALTEARDALDSVDLEALDLDTEVDVEIATGALDRRLFAAQVVQDHLWDPLRHLPGEALHPLLVREHLPVEDRLRAVAARLALVPDRLRAAERTLEGVPEVHARVGAQQARGALALVRDGVSALLERAPGLRPRVEPAQAVAAAALERYAAFLEGLPGEGDPRLGAQRFAGTLHLLLDADTTAEQVVQAAWANLEEVTEQLERVARDWVGDVEDPVREALARCAASAPDDASIVPLARQELAATAAAVRELGLATVPDDPAEVQVMPEHRRGVAVAYCDPPGPLEKGGVTQFAISPTPAGWSAERVASFYREYNTAMITNLTVHEAMPGHVLQLAHARRHPSRVRAVLWSGSFVEGWAVHAERLMAEAGHGGVPVRLQQLKMQLRMTLNALLDHGVHAGGMEEAEGLELMTRRGHQEEGEAVGKWQRALLTSGQLSTYFVGYLELSPLLAGRSTFDEVLAHGSPPPRHLRALLGA